MANKISLTRYLVTEQRIDGVIPADLRLLLEVVARACKRISLAVNKGALGGVAAGEFADAFVNTRFEPFEFAVGDVEEIAGAAIRRANTCCCSILWTAPATSMSTSALARFSAC